jgi:SsrA-binding protein
MSASKKGNGEKVAAVNRKARHEWELEEFFEAGIELVGSEVKSLRAGNVSLQEAFARPEKNEIWLYGMHIDVWDKGSAFQPDPKRKRRLLLKRYEIRKLIGKINQKGYSLIPVKIYFKKGWAKVDLALARGKKLYDKRQSLREKTARREMERAFKSREY